MTAPWDGGDESRTDATVAELNRLREREAHFAKVLMVADGGQYRNDWGAAIQRVVDDRDRYRNLLRRIVNTEGFWGREAHIALHPESAAARRRARGDYS